jgi:tetratricopeptide (TPR) repeat protein
MFSKATKQDPGNFRMRANLARTLHQSGNQQQAIVEMQQAADRSNNDPKMLVELGEMYLQSGQWLPAKRQAELAIEAHPRYAPGWFLLGKTVAAKGQHEDALAIYHKALGLMGLMGLDANVPEIQLAIVETYRQLDMPLRALSSIEQFLDQHPMHEQPESAVITKSLVLMDLKQVTPAIELLQTASQRESASSSVFIRLGQAQLMAGQQSQARMTLSRGKQAFPQDQVFDELIAQLTSDRQRVAAVGTSSTEVR